MQARIAPGSGDAPWVLLPGLYQALHETPPPRLQLVPDTFRLCNARICWTLPCASSHF